MIRLDTWKNSRIVIETVCEQGEGLAEPVAAVGDQGLPDVCGHQCAGVVAREDGRHRQPQHALDVFTADFSRTLYRLITTCTRDFEYRWRSSAAMAVPLCSADSSCVTTSVAMVMGSRASSTSRLNRGMSMTT